MILHIKTATTHMLLGGERCVSSCLANGFLQHGIRDRRVPEIFTVNAKTI